MKIAKELADTNRAYTPKAKERRQCELRGVIVGVVDGLKCNHRSARGDVNDTL
jgi:hypothetical protein